MRLELPGASDLEFEGSRLGSSQEMACSAKFISDEVGEMVAFAGATAHGRMAQTAVAMERFPACS